MKNKNKKESCDLFRVSANMQKEDQQIKTFENYAKNNIDVALEIMGINKQLKDGTTN